MFQAFHEQLNVLDFSLYIFISLLNRAKISISRELILASF